MNDPRRQHQALRESIDRLDVELRALSLMPAPENEWREACALYPWLAAWCGVNARVLDAARQVVEASK